MTQAKKRPCMERADFCKIYCYGYGICDQQKEKIKPLVDCLHECNWFEYVDETVPPKCEKFCLRWMSFHDWPAHCTTCADKTMCVACYGRWV